MLKASFDAVSANRLIANELRNGVYHTAKHAVLQAETGHIAARNGSSHCAIWHIRKTKQAAAGFSCISASWGRWRMSTPQDAQWHGSVDGTYPLVFYQPDEQQGTVTKRRLIFHQMNVSKLPNWFGMVSTCHLLFQRRGQCVLSWLYADIHISSSLNRPLEPEAGRNHLGLYDPSGLKKQWAHESWARQNP